MWFRILARAWGVKKLPPPPEITHPDRRVAKPNVRVFTVGEFLASQRKEVNTPA